MTVTVTRLAQYQAECRACESKMTYLYADTYEVMSDGVAQRRLDCPHCRAVVAHEQGWKTGYVLPDQETDEEALAWDEAISEDFVPLRLRQESQAYREQSGYHRDCTDPALCRSRECVVYQRLANAITEPDHPRRIGEQPRRLPDYCRLPACGCNGEAHP